MLKTIATSILLVVLIFFACSKEENNKKLTKQSQPVIVVSNYPLGYFCERIAMPFIDVKFPADVADDPAHWNPDPNEIASLQNADLIIINGASYENWLNKVSLPNFKIVNTTKPVQERLIPLADNVTHSHGPEGEHAHGGTAFTTWLDFSLAIEQATVIRDAFIKLMPGKAPELNTNYQKLVADLQLLDKRLGQMVTSDTPLIFSHPVYQYLEKKYSLNGASVHWEPDQAPDPAMWREFDKILKKHPAKWMIWEGAPLESTVTMLQERGIQSIIFDPCAHRPETGDFISVMDTNMAELEKIYQ